MLVDTERLWEKLYPATWKLARSADTIHERVGEAFRAIGDLKGEDFGPEERIIFNELTARITRAGPIVENGAVKTGAVDNTLAAMTEAEASEVAESIFELFVQVSEQHFAN
jgi:hypothetical protein